MAKPNSLIILICAVSGFLLTAFFFIAKFEAKPSYNQTSKAVLLSYIPPLEYIGEREYLSQVSLLQPKIFDDVNYMDTMRELESFKPIIDTVIYIPEQFKVKQKDRW